MSNPPFRVYCHQNLRLGLVLRSPSKRCYGKSVGISNVDMAVGFCKIEDVFGSITATDCKILIAGLVSSAKPVIREVVPVLYFERMIVEVLGDVKRSELGLLFHLIIEMIQTQKTIK